MPAVPALLAGQADFMKLIAIVVAAASAAFLGLSQGQANALPLFVPVSGFVLAAILWLARDISIFLRIFMGMYALGYLLIAAANTLASYGLVPQTLAALVPPAFMATASVCFAGLVFGVSFIPVVRTITNLADPYFYSIRSGEENFSWFGRLFRSEGRAAVAMVAAIIATNFVQVGLNIKFNLWYRDLFDALQNKNADAFWYQIWWVFIPLLVFWIIFQLLDFTIDTIFRIRWRQWLTESYFSRWLDRSTHYKMGVAGQNADNPDQRISVDVAAFISSTMTLSTQMMAQLATLVSFTVLLWGLSEGFTFPGTAVVIPGLLVWVAVAYSLVGTILTHLIGRPLIRLDFLQEKFEANFRFSLARLREYGEQVALLRGADAEKANLRGGFAQVITNVIDILKRRLKIEGFRFSWQQMSVAFPYLFMGPYFFLDRITLGQLQQGAQAFGQVNASLSFFISAYTTLAAYKATIDRLVTFEDAMGRAEVIGTVPPHIERKTAPENALVIRDLRVDLPHGVRIVEIDRLDLRAGEPVLVNGPSGSGKSTLFRALAGIWPYGSGEVDVPEGRSVMLLPQRPYIPQGNLRAAISYPAVAGAYDDAAIRAVLIAVGLPALVNRLDDDDNWGQRLSGGEQQRLAIARALLAKPDWLLLDEASSALDEKSERVLYEAIAAALPDTTIVSIGHRSTLAAFHDRRIDLQPMDDGVARPVDLAREPVPVG